MNKRKEIKKSGVSKVTDQKRKEIVTMKKTDSEDEKIIDFDFFGFTGNQLGAFSMINYEIWIQLFFSDYWLVGFNIMAGLIVLIGYSFPEIHNKTIEHIGEKGYLTLLFLFPIVPVLVYSIKLIFITPKVYVSKYQ
ncbi:hypothetical protein AUJ87_03530 [Candidatus Gracilibacteria bacterium CG1_02_38_174]|nr:MAG: hypothetical protein AUJ87_03530 [Candidatus Gracilibacteria bacterium CG1_02_38_174]PIQ11378.1 MAG: hypothetical protein COW68_02805 [Candidatus Gracilibacteria bacterium CG18_big_fil_WC_8_21_14_2_50_38_16]PIQ41941.1 MAG: hypothetical protein COW06_01230 [Candidatus Gracilibacteria bacterium CG12_big_fil_rev_8_21_14_0_65_38_15]PIZ01286.1 MAG: hypothetical protein COY60_04335 [Candidatus Gracilibacteria bacterium CG_4_10_14_0_8_um_filter_38_28]